MKIVKLVYTVLLLLLLGSSGRAFCWEKAKNDYPITPVPFTNVRLNDCFWLPKIETDMTVSIPTAFRQCEVTGRIDNFAIAGGLKKGEHKGDFPFDDTDVYKVIEGASYSLAVKYNPALDSYIDSLITIIKSAQEPDGYLYTARTNNAAKLKRWMGEKRWEKTNSHELYNMGHLYEAACAHFLATGKKSLLDIALENAELLLKDFGPNEGQRHSPSGHQIIEMGLAKLFRFTGDRRYIELAGYFINELGRANDGRKLSEYRQDHKPVVEQSEAVGHAVSGAYNFSGIADVAALTGNNEYIAAIDRLWENVVEKKLYITGGIGQRAWGEGFGPEFELPNMTAYCETCAAIANVYWNYRLFLLHGDSKYIDVLELALYNGVLSGVSLNGSRYFYDNPLESCGQHERSEWFGCACCPSNITRFIPSIPGYIYAAQNNAVYINLFASNSAIIKLDCGDFEIQQQTNYPWDGNVLITVKSSPEVPVKLKIRVPGWASGKPVPGGLYKFAAPDSVLSFLAVNGKTENLKTESGYLTIERKWKGGDTINFTLPMPAQRVIADPHVSYDLGKAAIQRGPLIYCLEGRDNPGKRALNIAIPVENLISAEFEKNTLNGVVVLKGKCILREPDNNGGINIKAGEFKAVPYYTWNNRGKGEMAVWIPVEGKFARPVPLPSIASQSKCNYSSDEIYGLNDQIEPDSSGDLSTPCFYWWLKTGSRQYVEYQFEKEEDVSESGVYWLVKDHYDVSYRVPDEWKLLYKTGEGWKPVENLSPYALEKDKYNTVYFKRVKTNGLRLEAKLKKEFSGGIIEWKVK